MLSLIISKERQAVSEVAIHCCVCGKALILENAAQWYGYLSAECPSCQTGYSLDTKRWKEGYLLLKMQAEIQVSETR